MVRIFQEENSVDTSQNAFFTKMLHLEPLKIKHIVVVSNAFHIPRVKQIFTSLFDSSYKMDFLSAVDPIVDEWVANKQLDIEKGAREFNEKRLFCSDVYDNLSALHSLIFETNSIIAENYRNLIANF